MYAEDELLAISALQHLAFCERQWGLIHLEGAWAENQLTAEGRVLHERAHEADWEVRGDQCIARGLPLRSLRLGLVGVADVVEFFPDPAGTALPRAKGHWRPMPVEYKRGRPKRGSCDEVQLCAQALCLEEMLDTPIPEGALFYGQTRRRSDVTFGPELRAQTEALAQRLHALTAGGRTPSAAYAKAKCDRCSIREQCMPKTAGEGKKTGRYFQRIFREAKEDLGDPNA